MLKFALDNIQSDYILSFDEIVPYQAYQKNFAGKKRTH